MGRRPLEGKGMSAVSRSTYPRQCSVEAQSTTNSPPAEPAVGRHRPDATANRSGLLPASHLPVACITAPVLPAGLAGNSVDTSGPDYRKLGDDSSVHTRATILAQSCIDARPMVGANPVLARDMLRKLFANGHNPVKTHRTRSGAPYCAARRHAQQRWHLGTRISF